MSAPPVVETFDVFEDRVRQLESGTPALPVEQFGLHPGPERLDDGVVVGVADGAHRGQQAGVFGPLGERPGGVLRAPDALLFVKRLETSRLPWVAA